ncbi:hypothetical protein [Streptomyces sp. NBC_00582]|uniref:hypothetical protein n=1 Tax=Streptomyces sp. NBC_00582 TaxID=2975783 RepID=UPI001414F2A4|nr:hypothetical protein [Streptomyces sp. NBC_00582]WUB59195.1 hypothetical protein OG852_01435 [Streptomyces sp. NBC_00582]
MRTEVGVLYLEQHRMAISDDPDQRVIIHVPDPGSDSLDRMRRLAEQATADPLATNGRA